MIFELQFFYELLWTLHSQCLCSLLLLLRINSFVRFLFITNILACFFKIIFVLYFAIILCLQHWINFNSLGETVKMTTFKEKKRTMKKRNAVFEGLCHILCLFQEKGKMNIFQFLKQTFLFFWCNCPFHTNVWMQKRNAAFDEKLKLVATQSAMQLRVSS